MMPDAVQATHRNRGLTSLTEVALLLLAPLLSYWVMHFHPIMQRGALDPYIYTGYIHNFDDLFERYGPTYYGVRFGAILPGQLATALFGPIAGYFVVRYVVALTAGVPLYLLVRQQHGRPAATAVFALFITSPFLARTLLWDYTDSTAVPFLFAAVCLYLIELHRRRLADVCTGALAGLALHSHVFTLLPLTIFFGAHTAVWLIWRRDSGLVLRRLLHVSAAVVAVSVAGALYYWWRVGYLDIFSITATNSGWMLGGGSENWRTPGADWVAQQWWVLTPLVLVLLLPLVHPYRRMTFGDAVVWTSGAGVVLFCYAYQFALNGFVLQYFYYFSYLLPFMFLPLSTILAAVLKSSARSSWLLAAVFIVASVGPWVLHSYEVINLRDIRFDHYLAIITVASVVIVAAVRFRSTSQVASLAAVALGLLIVGTFSGPTSNYVSTLNSRFQPARLELDVYRVALQLMANVPRWSERPGVLFFWYSNNPPDNSMQSIQSTYLWGRSKVQREGGAGLPELSSADVDVIRRPRVKMLMLLAEKEEQLAEGRAALRQHGIRHSILNHRTISQPTYTLYLELIELDKDS